MTVLVLVGNFPLVGGLFHCVLYILFFMARTGHAVTCGYIAGGNTGLTKAQKAYIAKCQAERAAVSRHTANIAKQQAQDIMSSNLYVYFEPK
jgi:hypothetical protein